MNIVREQREGGVSLLSVTVGEADYAADVEKALRDYRRKANIPGFRPGMVPMGIVKKMYGKGVVAEQSYRMASNAAFDYLQKEKIDYLGDVIPSDEQGGFDFVKASHLNQNPLRRAEKNICTADGGPVTLKRDAAVLHLHNLISQIQNFPF